jgi:anaerobic magnesium-protoporphyrin IX monomethyl ester cyclase
VKLLLCHPNQKVSFEGMKARPMVSPPLGLLLIAAYLRNSGWQGEIRVYDARLSGKFSRNAEGERIFGDTDAEAAERVAATAPVVVGISNMFTSQIGRAYSLADAVRQRLPKAVIVIGGPHVTVFPGEALQRPSIDYVVRGEGEERMASLMEALGKSIRPEVDGVLGKADLAPGAEPPPLTFIRDLDRLPLPAYDLINFEAYWDLARRGYSPRHREWGQRPVTLITSRGCPHVCAFCSIHTTMGYKYRSHSSEYVRRHIRHLVDHYGVDFVHFEDDNFTHVPERCDAIIADLAKLNPKIGWDTPNGLRGDSWTYERVKNAKDSGCKFLTVAVESAVPRVLDEIIHKRLDLSKVEDVIRWCQEVNLRLHAFYIIGLPGETLDEMRATIRFALDRYRRFGVTPFLQPLVPIPNTRLYETIRQGGLFRGKLETKHNQVTTAEFTPEQVRRLYRDYLWRRIGIFLLRTATTRRDCAYNIRLVLKYPRAVLEAARIAIGADS